MRHLQNPSPPAKDTGKGPYPAGPRAAAFCVKGACLALACGLLALAGPAWSVDAQAPQIERFGARPVVAQEACADLLAAPAHRAADEREKRTREKNVALPATILGVMVGARYATGPRETHLVRAGSAAPVTPQAIASWRRCQAEAALRDLAPPGKT